MATNRRRPPAIPLTLTRAGLEAYVCFLDRDREAVAAEETLTGRALSSLTFEGKVAALAEVLAAGRASAALATAA